MLKLISSVLFLFAAVVIESSTLAAEPRHEIFKRSCGTYESGEDFVKRSSVYCINQGNTRSCMKQARSFFQRCRYSGNFKDLVQGVQEKLLVMLFVTKSTDLAKPL